MENKYSSSRQSYEQELTEKGLLNQSGLPLTPVKSCGHWLGLLTKQAFEDLPDGTAVVSIHGKRLTKGEDYIDLDARGGQISFGIPIEGADAETLSAIYGDPAVRE